MSTSQTPDPEHDRLEVEIFQAPRTGAEALTAALAARKKGATRAPV